MAGSLNYNLNWLVGGHNVGMTKGEFYSEVLKLVKRYGDKYYPPEVLREIFMEVEMLPLEWFKRLITKLLATERFAPLLPTFKDHAVAEKRRLHLVKAPQFNNTFESNFTDEERAELLALVRAVGRSLIDGPTATKYAESIVEIANKRVKG